MYSDAGAPQPPAPISGPNGGVYGNQTGTIGGPGQVAPPQFVGGPTLGSVDLNALFRGAGGGSTQSGPVLSDVRTTGSVTPPPVAQTALTSPAVSTPVGNILNQITGNALGLEQQGLGQLDAALNAARQRAIINFGDPSLAEQAGFGLDPQAGAFAQQNYISGNATLARLDRAHQLAQQAVVNRLAGRGLLNSGDLGYLEGQENQQYGNNVYDARQAVLDQLSTLLQNYLGSRQGLSQDTINAQQNALNAFLSNPDAYTALFGPSQQSVQPARVTPAGSARKALTSYKGVKGPQIGAFK